MPDPNLVAQILTAATLLGFGISAALRIRRRRWNETVAVRSMIHAADRMCDRWSEGNQDVKTELWRELHMQADALGDQFADRIERATKRGYRLDERAMHKADRKATT